jgi:hypothetical protein
MTIVEKLLLEHSYPDLYHDLNLIRQEWRNKTSQEIRENIERIRFQIVQLNRTNAIEYKNQGGSLPSLDLNNLLCYQKFVKSKLLFQVSGINVEHLIDDYNHENIFNFIKTFLKDSKMPIGVVTRITGFTSSVITPIKNADTITHSFKHLIKNVEYFNNANRNSNLGLLVNMFVDTISQICYRVAEDENYFHNHGIIKTRNISGVHQALGMNNIDPTEYYI